MKEYQKTTIRAIISLLFGVFFVYSQEDFLSEAMGTAFFFISGGFTIFAIWEYDHNF